MPDSPHHPIQRARELARRAGDQAEELEARLRRLSRFRIGTFLLGVVPLLMLETSPRGWWPPLLVAAAVGALGFVIFVRKHRGVRNVQRGFRIRRQLHLEALARMDRRWDDVPEPGLGQAPDDHPFASDLDILGRGSLAHLLGAPGTAPGRAALGRALLQPLSPPPRRGEELLADSPSPEPAPGASDGPEEGWHMSLQDRQAAVETLAGTPDLLDELALAAREVEGRSSRREAVAFLRWAESDPWLEGRVWMVWAARGLSVLNLGALTAWLTGLLGPPVWILSMVATHLLHRASSQEAGARFAAAEGGQNDPARWAGVLEVSRRLPRGDSILDRIRALADQPSPGASGALARLRRINDVASVRYSGLAHFPLVTLFAWDLHVLHRLESWQQRYGRHAEAWVQGVAELELLAALARLSHEHPSWNFPTFGDEPTGTIEGRNLGHPLLRPDTCVGNDVKLPPPGRLLLVTGSNMAGKTTLLRALGANQVLALIGGPVAADGFRTRPVQPWTAMRVRDSVTEGVSFFMAELQRLERVVRAARSRPVLFLLDEILQGTNTAERRTAARIILRHLLRTEAVGAVTTHDLTLADAEDLKARSIDVHFREEVIEVNGKRQLHFDYLLRPGPATSRNALLLLEMVGLGEESSPPPPGPSTEAPDGQQPT
jgi:hypothetical protein